MKLFSTTLRISKEDPYEHEELTPEQQMMLATALYEVRFLVDVDTGIIFAVNDQILDTAQTYEGTE